MLGPAGIAAGCEMLVEGVVMLGANIGREGLQDPQAVTRRYRYRVSRYIDRDCVRYCTRNEC